MDVFYEESSTARNAAAGVRKYRIIQIISNIFLGIGIFGLIFMISFLPLNTWIFWLLICSWFFITWFLLFRFKRRFNLNFDYSFVSGELRIAKVFNVNKRKPLVKIQAEDIIQVGDVDNTAFDGFRADPNVKTIFCTSNDVAMEGKFFMYILVSDNGRKLYVLECREELLMHMMKFLKRTVLESDYVPQEKKRR